MNQLTLPQPEQPYAVLIGLDSLQGLQAARVLARRGVPVIGLARDPDDYHCRTNVCQRIFFTETETPELIDTLEALGPKLGPKAVLFPCEDANVLLVSKYRERLEPWYHILLPEHQVLETLMDKVNFYRFAQKEGLPIPITFIVHSREEMEQAAQEVDFPCVLKPPMSAAPEWEHNTMMKAFLVHDREELLALYDQYHRWAPCFIVQSWIPGPDTQLFTCNCYFDQEGQPILSFTTRKLRQWPPVTGQSCLSELAPNPLVAEVTLDLYRRVQHRGLGYLEMKQDARTGEYLIVEPNVGRPTGRFSNGEMAGLELLYTMYCDLLGWPLPENRLRQPQLKWIHLRRDIQAVLRGLRRRELTLGQWLASWRGPKTFGVFSWRDPAPFFWDVVRVVRLLFSAQERAKRQYDEPLKAKSNPSWARHP